MIDEDKLRKIRSEIDAIDDELERALRRRDDLAREAQSAKGTDAPLYVAKREAEIVEARERRSALFRQLLRSSRSDLVDVERALPRDVLRESGFALVAGPCSVESEAHALETASALATTGVRRMRGGCWKPRTSPHAFQGHGEAALSWMRAACDRFGLELWTEVRDVANLEFAAMIDVAWIGARNATNVELLRAVGRRCPRVVLKRGPAQTVEEWLQAAEYVRIGGARVALCERGIRGFDPMLRNALDLPGALLARAMGGVEVLVDASHATGLAPLVAPMIRAARAAGLDGAIVEAHPRPSESITDARQALSLDAVARLAREVA